MKVLHVISGLGRGGGGPARSCQGLVAAERAAGVDAWLWPIGGGKPWVEGVRDVACRIDDAEELRRTLRGFDIVHIHGLWDPRLHKVALACRREGVKYVIAPRGMLEPWSLRQKWLKKRIARWLYQDRDLKCAAALHATAGSEAEQFRNLGFKNPIIVSPNGVNVPSRFEPRATPNARRRALFVSRMHPKKGVLELVEAWSRTIKDTVNGEGEEGWVCELVYTVSGGLEKEYEARVKQRVLALGMSYQDADGAIHSPSSSPSSPNFVFTGELNDDEKWKAYARADLFVLPTYSENFGIVVAEALWAGVPVITTKGTPWSELEGARPPDHSSRCGWWIDLPPAESLERALAEATTLDSRVLAEMGGRGRRLVEEKYTWEAVVKPMISGYLELANSSTPQLAYSP